ncbi:MAG: hypothetical protein HC848_08875, partial [Limnobacter sp.]|nr:hypothetical protein [Limnobacter sp.]
MHAIQIFSEDAQIRHILFQFLDSYWESTPRLDAIRGVAKGTVTITLEIVLMLGVPLAAPAVLTRLAARMGQFSARAIELLVHLYKLLKARAQKTLHTATEGLERLSKWPKPQPPAQPPKKPPPRHQSPIHTPPQPPPRHHPQQPQLPQHPHRRLPHQSHQRRRTAT